MRADSVVGEVGVGQRLRRSQPLLRVEEQHPVEEVAGAGVEIRQDRCHAAAARVREVAAEDARLLRPVRLGGRPEHVEDLAKLVDLVLAGEEGLPGDELGEDASAAPEVDGRGVGGAQEDLGGAVPQRHNLDTGCQKTVWNICLINQIQVVQAYR